MRTLGLVAGLLFLVGCSGDSRRQGVHILQTYGFVSSSLHENLARESIDLANVLLGLDTEYQLSLGDSKTPGRIPVYLVTGDQLGEKEYARKLDDARALILNADRISDLVRRFGGEYDDRQVIDRSASFKIFPEGQTFARCAVTFVLMHEVGHIWQQDHGPYTGTPLVSYEQIKSASGKSREVELEADKFVSDRLLLANESLARTMDGDLESPFLGPKMTTSEYFQKFNNDREKFLAAKRLDGRRMRAAVESHHCLSEIQEKVVRKKPFEGISSISHLDLDLRAYVYFALSSVSMRKSETTREQNSIPELGALLIQDREIERRFLVAKAKAILTHRTLATDGRYALFIELLRDPDVDVRTGAAGALRALEPHGDEILPALVDALNEKYGRTHGVTYTLCSMGARAVPALIQTLNQSTKDSVRENALICLAGMLPADYVAARNVLKKVVANETNESIKERAQHLLSQQDEAGLGDK
jgi:hypothetical protein